jgi:plastocyanin
MKARRALVVGLMLAIVAIGLAAFFTYAAPPSSGRASSPTPPQTSHAASEVLVLIAQGAAVNTKDPGYRPAVIKVVLGVNNTVVWKSLDNSVHDVFFPALNLKSPDLYLGDSWNYTFTSPGTYSYVCSYHPWMKGEVIVLPAP